MSNDNLGNEVSDFLPRLHCITFCGTTSFTINAGKIYVFKQIYKDLSNLILIKLLELRMTLTEKIVQKPKIFVETIIHNGKLNEGNLSTRVWSNENVK